MSSSHITKSFWNYMYTQLFLPLQSANQSATATIGTLHREIREMKPFRLCSPIWLIIRPTGLEPGPMLSGRLFVTCKTVSFRSERHRWSRRSQNTKTRFSSARASWEWRISAFVWALEESVRLSVPVWADTCTLLPDRSFASNGT